MSASDPTGHPHSSPNAAASSRTDSAGVPWEGRAVPNPGFADDDGSTDPRLEAALAAWAAGRDADAEGDGLRQEEVVAALAAARVLVPILAVLGEAEEPVAQVGDKSADMALVTLAAPDGGTAVPVFTSLARLTEWRPDARPVPAEAQRVALSAVSDGAAWLVVDPGGPVTFAVARAPLWALAQGRPWRQPHRDDTVVTAVSDALDGAPHVLGRHLDTRGAAQLVVSVALPPGLDEAAVSSVAQDLGARLGRLDVVRERVDGVALRFVPA
ncbi:MAG: SseB family protein [Actinomycetales bacterium]